jgi:hypothetical protein
MLAAVVTDIGWDLLDDDDGIASLQRHGHPAELCFPFLAEAAFPFHNLRSYQPALGPAAWTSGGA